MSITKAREQRAQAVKAQKKPASRSGAGIASTGKGSSTATSDAPTDYASALKDQRTKLAEAEARVKDPTTPAADLLQSKERIDMLRSAVKTLEGAAQRERQAKLSAAGARPIDSTDEPFTFATPRALGMTYEPGVGTGRDETSRGQLFAAGGKTSEQRAEAGTKLRAEIEDLRKKAESAIAERTANDRLLKQLKRQPNETAPEYQERLDPVFRGVGRGYLQTMQQRIAGIEARSAELSNEYKQYGKRIGELERGLIVAGDSATSPSVVAGRAQKQREQAKAAEPVVLDEQEEALRRMNKEAMENISDEEIRMLGMGSGGY
jgi:hypothetical protein